MKYKALTLTTLLFGICKTEADPRILYGGAEPGVAPPALDLIQVEPQDSSGPLLHGAATVYSIGDPTPEEQLYLEFINRARANPTAEGAFLAQITDPTVALSYQAFQVDLALMQNQFAAIAPAQPLAMNAKLISAARVHSLDMYENVFLDHTGSDGSTPGQRIERAGYVGQAGENIFANAQSVLHGHAAFEVDWGDANMPTVGGMQNPPGHRNSIHNPLFREVGIGIFLGSKTIPGKQPLDHVGPQLVTQEFGVALGSIPFITGVAYYDLNGNKFYDAGEGIGNVRVSVPGVSFEGITARSGGYAIPVPTNGNYTVTFSGSGFTGFSQNVTVAGSKNVKSDFLPTYTPPSISGPSVAPINRSTTYSVSAVPGASAYEWRVFQKAAARPEGAEANPPRVSIEQTGTYDVIQGLLVKSGSFAFHLVTPAQAARSQYVTLLPTYLVKPSSSISFQSSLGFATPDQHARVQISVDGGLTWQTIYNQDGDPDHPETDFAQPQLSWRQRTVALDAFAGRQARFRFAFEFNRGQFFNGTDPEIGWLIDDIQFSNVDEITNDRVSAVVGSSFQFSPESEGDFSLQVRAKTGHDFLDWGPAISVRSVSPTGAPQLAIGVVVNGQGQLQFDIQLTAGSTPEKLTLESRDNLSSPWQTDGANVQAITPSSFRVVLAQPGNSSTRFYRIRAE